MRRHLTWAGYGMVALAVLGCAAKPETPPKTPEQVQAEQKLRLHQALMAKFEPLAPTGAVIEEGGRRFQVYQAATKPNSPITFSNPLTPGVYQPITIGKKGDEYQELRDADTGEVVVEFDYVRFQHIPGRGLYMRPRDNRRQEACFGLWPPASKLHEGQPWRLRIENLQKFDPAGGTFVASDIMVIETYPADAKTARPERLAIYRRKAPTRIDVEIITPEGKTVGVYENVAVAAWPRSTISELGKFAMIRTRKPDGSLQPYLLDVNKDVLAVPSEGMLEIGHLLARPVPGTAPGEDLWAILQDDGSFATPAGVVGFRPVQRKWRDTTRETAMKSAEKRDVSYWLVRYAMPGEPAYDATVNPAPAKRWGWASYKVAKLSGPIWLAADLVASPYWSWGNEYWHEPFLVVQEPNGRSQALAIQTEYQKDLIYVPDLDRLVSRGTYSSIPDAARATLALFHDQAVRKVRADAADRAKRRTELLAEWKRISGTSNLAAIRSVAWELGGEHLYYYGLRCQNPAEMEAIAASISGTLPAMSKELSAKAKTFHADQAKRRAEIAKAEYEALMRQKNAPAVYTGDGSNPFNPQLGKSSYTGPSEQQRMENYKHNLDVKIGTGQFSPYTR